jgi:hypothetical protein
MAGPVRRFSLTGSGFPAIAFLDVLKPSVSGWDAVM